MGESDARPSYTPAFNRIHDALTGRPVDRVPLFDFVMARNVKEAFLGRPIATEADEIDFWTRAGYDYAVASVAVPFPGVSTASSGIRDIHWSDEHRGPIGTWDDFRSYPWPDPSALDYSPVEKVCALLPEGVKVLTVAGNFYAKVQALLSFENLALLVYDDPKLLEAVFDRVADISYASLDRVTRIPGVGAVVSGGDIAFEGGTFIDPGVLRKIVFPRYRKLTALCHQRSIPVVHHSDGDLGAVMEDLIEAGFDGFHPFEPKAMDIIEAKRRYGDRICILGNIDVDLLARGSAAEIREAVRGKIRDLAPGGRYCVGSSNSIAPYVPVENFRAMVEAAWEFGGL
jgi:uroporphyrinogen decarboxylase